MKRIIKIAFLVGIIFFVILPMNSFFSFMDTANSIPYMNISIYLMWSIISSILLFLVYNKVNSNIKYVFIGLWIVLSMIILAVFGISQSLLPNQSRNLLFIIMLPVSFLIVTLLILVLPITSISQLKLEGKKNILRLKIYDVLDNERCLYNDIQSNSKVSNRMISFIHLLQGLSEDKYKSENFIMEFQKSFILNKVTDKINIKNFSFDEIRLALQDIEKKIEKLEKEIIFVNGVISEKEFEELWNKYFYTN